MKIETSSSNDQNIDSSYDTSDEPNEVVEWTKSDAKSSACHLVYESTSKTGCRTDVIKEIRPVLNFSGTIMIVLGLALVFYGARLFPWVLGG